MNSAELKLDLFRKIDSLKKTQLNELSGALSNILHSSKSTNEWDILSNAEKDGILLAKKNIRKTGGTDNTIAMKRFRKTN